MAVPAISGSRFERDSGQFLQYQGREFRGEANGKMVST
jgi:hypothetical protein